MWPVFFFFIVSWYVTRVLVKITLFSWLVVYFGFILEQAQPVIYLICLVFILHGRRLLGVCFTQSSSRLLIFSRNSGCSVG